MFTWCERDGDRIAPRMRTFIACLTVALLGVRFPFAEALLTRYQVDAVWWSFPVSSLLAAALAVLYYRYGDWRHAQMALPARS